MTTYEGTEVSIRIEAADAHEARVKVGDDTLIWISRSEQPEFEKELVTLLDKYRI